MTKHEIEILNIMRSRGKTATDIALALQVSVNTALTSAATRRKMRFGSDAAGAGNRYSK